MINALKSDLRKLLTIRSTYIMSAIAVLLTSGISFYFEGYKGNSGSPAATLGSNALEVIISTTAGFSVVFITIVAILSVAHEYRYNTIMYTLTSNASRTKALASKCMVLTAYAVIFGLITCALAIGSYMIGLSLRDVSLPAQDFDILTQIGRISAYFAGYALVGLLLATLIRNLVGAIVIFLIAPSTIESLLSVFILKDNGVYLPFRSLDNIVGISTVDNPGGVLGSTVSPATSIAVAAIYIIIALLVTWVLYLRRDSN